MSTSEPSLPDWEKFKGRSEKVISLLQSKLSALIVESSIELGDAVVRVNREKLLEFVKIIRLDTELDLNYLVDITVIDWMDSRPERFEVIYHFLSTAREHRLRVKAWVPEHQPEIESVVSLWPGAAFMEREAFDMYGVKFNGNSDMRRILLYEEFVGHPLRKDYPVQGKQPRIPLRAPEVENTARHMQRPALVAINKKKESSGQNGAAH